MRAVARWRWCGGLLGRWTSSCGLSGSSIASAAARLYPETGFELSRELRCGLAEHGEVPQQGITALAVGFQLADRDASGQLPGLLRGIDHLGEQEDVTLHRRAWLLPGLTAAAAGAGSAATPGRPGGRTIR